MIGLLEWRQELPLNAAGPTWPGEVKRMNLSERIILRTMESPCRKCPQRFEDRELCMHDCHKLESFQNAMVRSHEERVRWFSSRLRAA
jgi:hypothetical protein